MTHPTVAELTRAHRTWWPWAVLVIAALGTGASNAANDVHPIAPAVALVVAATLPAVMPPLAGRAATAALVASGALCGIYFALGYADGPVFLALPTATFLVAAAVPVRRWLPGALAGVVLLAAGLAARWEWHADEPHKSLWQGIGMVGVVLAAGAVATATRNRFEARAERVERAATEERLRMAQDLHDGVGHGLAVIAMQAGVALHVLDRDTEAARSSLEAIRTTSREALDALRTELATIAGEPAPRRPAAGVEAIPALVERVRSAGLRLEVIGEPGELTPQAGAAAYAVLQEALTNVLRHAAAGTATVVWERGADTVALRVSDDGQGGEVQDEGMGISGMRARVEALGGSLRAGPTEHGGFEVSAVLPT
ncbi:sensor histidine kinase [Pimelobacter simplex]|uniref:sensor histidine kinase n=1 Tax=Nocardioides simplex TaxID=2045 RepID=UPI001933A8B0|nr:sensor histidine kinase [Pimelobacter simplex]